LQKKLRFNSTITIGAIDSADAHKGNRGETVFTMRTVHGFFVHVFASFFDPYVRIRGKEKEGVFKGFE